MTRGCKSACWTLLILPDLHSDESVEWRSGKIASVQPCNQLFQHKQSTPTPSCCSSRVNCGCKSVFWSLLILLDLHSDVRMEWRSGKIVSVQPWYQLFQHKQSKGKGFVGWDLKWVYSVSTPDLNLSRIAIFSFLHCPLAKQVRPPNDCYLGARWPYSLEGCSQCPQIRWGDLHFHVAWN